MGSGRIGRYLRARRAASALTYAVILGLVGVVSIVSVNRIGSSVTDIFDGVGDAIGAEGLAAPLVFADITDAHPGDPQSTGAAKSLQIDGSQELQLRVLGPGDLVVTLTTQSGVKTVTAGGGAVSVVDGDSLVLEMPAADDYETEKLAELAIGVSNATWSVTTGDAMPDDVDLALTEEGPFVPGTIVSTQTVSLGGATLPFPITVSEAGNVTGDGTSISYGEGVPTGMFRVSLDDGQTWFESESGAPVTVTHDPALGTAELVIEAAAGPLPDGTNRQLTVSLGEGPEPLLKTVAVPIVDWVPGSLALVPESPLDWQRQDGTGPVFEHNIWVTFEALELSDLDAGASVTFSLAEAGSPLELTGAPGSPVEYRVALEADLEDAVWVPAGIDPVALELDQLVQIRARSGASDGVLRTVGVEISDVTASAVIENGVSETGTATGPLVVAAPLDYTAADASPVFTRDTQVTFEPFTPGPDFTLPSLLTAQVTENGSGISSAGLEMRIGALVDLQAPEQAGDGWATPDAVLGRLGVPGLRAPDESIQLRMNSAGGYGVSRVVTLNIGATPVLGTVATGTVAPDVPVFGTVDQIGAFQRAVSTPVQILGDAFTIPASVSISGPSVGAGEDPPEAELCVLTATRVDAAACDSQNAWGPGATIEPNESLILAMVSGPGNDSTRTASVTIGALSPVSWSVFAPDITPDPMSFGTTTGHTPDDWAISNAVQVTGISAPTRVEPLRNPADTGPGDGQPLYLGDFIGNGSEDAPQYPAQVSVDNGPFTRFANASPDSRVRLRRFIPASATTGSAYTMGVSVGALYGATPVVDTWTAEVAGTDFLPDALVMVNVTDAEPDQTFSSPELTPDPNSYDARADLIVTSTASSQPRVSIDGGPFQPAGYGDGVTVRPGQSLQIEVDVAGYDTQQTVTVAMGDRDGDQVTSLWTVRARGLSLEPTGNYVFSNVSAGQPYRAQVASGELTPTGFQDDIDVIVSLPTAERTRGAGNDSGSPRSRVTVSINGGTAVPLSNLSGQAFRLQSGQSIQAFLTVDWADGGNRLVNFKFGDADQYTWSVHTLDTHPNPLPVGYTTANNLRSPTQPGWAAGPSGRWEFVVSGVEDNMEVPIITPTAINRISPNCCAAPGTIRNGWTMGDYISAPSQPNSTSTYNYDLGGYTFSGQIASNNVSFNPRRYFFDVVDNAPNTGTVYSDYISPYQYGGCMPVEIISSSPSGCSGFLQVQTRSGGPCNGSYTGSTVYIQENYSGSSDDLLRVGATMQSGSETCDITVRYNNSTSRQVVFTARKAPSSASLLPEPFRISGTTINGAYQEKSITYDLSQWTPSIVDEQGGTFRRQSTGQPYDEIYHVWTDIVEGRTSFDDRFQTINDYSDTTNTLEVPLGASVRFVNYGFRIPGEQVVAKICAGDLSYRNDSAAENVHYRCVLHRITVLPADEDPDGPLNLAAVPGPSNAPNDSFVTSAAVSTGDIAAPIEVYLTDSSYLVSGGAASNDAGISVAGGSYTKCTSASPCTVRPGQSIRVGMRTGAGDGSARTIRAVLRGKNSSGSTVEYGLTGSTSTWTVQTLDSQPLLNGQPSSSFSFSDRVGAEPNTFTASTVVTVTDIAADTNFSVTGVGVASVEIDGNGNRVTSGVIQPGQTLRVWLFLDRGHNTAHSATLTIGSATETWSVTTRSQDITPEYTLPAFGAAPANVPVETSRIEPYDFLDGATLTALSDASGTLEVAINGEPYQPLSSGQSAPLQVFPGQFFTLRMTAPPAGQNRVARIRLGDVERDWSVTAQ